MQLGISYRYHFNITILLALSPFALRNEVLKTFLELITQLGLPMLKAL